MPGQLQRGHALAGLILGVIEVVCGLIIIIVSCVMMTKANVSVTMSPYWAGIIFAIPGIVGIVVGCTKNHGAMIAFMVLNIIAFVIQGVGAILVGVIIAVWLAIVADATKNCTKSAYDDTCYCRKDGSNFTVHGVKGDDCNILSTVASMAVAIIVFLVIAAITSLAASIVGCISVCCSNNNASAGVVFQPAPPAYQAQPTKY